MIGLEILGGSTLVAKLDRVSPALLKHTRIAMNTIGRMLERHVKTQKLSGQSLNVRTGNLRRAIFHKVGEVDGDVFVTVGVDLEKAKYGRIQELGGIIRPKKSQYLTIPIGRATTRAGVARFTARDLITSPGTYGYTGTFTRNRIIFGKRPGGGIEPLFVLKTQVTIRPVGYLSGSVKELRGDMLTVLRTELKNAVEDATG